MAAKWKSANLAAFIPAGFSDLLDAVNSTVSTVGGVLGALKSALEVAKTFLISFPIFDPASLLATAVLQFKEAFLGSGFYALVLWDYPLHQYYKSSQLVENSGTNGDTFKNSFMQDVAASFTDTGDDGRPPFTSGNVAMLVLVGGAPGIGGLSTLMTAMGEAFSWWTELQTVTAKLTRTQREIECRNAQAKIKAGQIRLVNSVAQFDRTKTLNDFKRARKDMVFLSDEQIAAAPPVGETASSITSYINYINATVKNSQYPDWQSISLRTIVPPLVNVFDQVFDPLIDSLKAGRDVVAAITAMIDVLTAKIDALDKVIFDITTYVDQLDALVSATGLYALYVESDVGVDDLVQKFRAAEDPPFGETKAFFTGLVLVAGGPSLPAFTALFKPIGGG